MEVTYPYLGHNLFQPTIWYFHFERTHISWVFGYRVIVGCKFCLSTLLIVALGLVAFLVGILNKWLLFDYWDNVWFLKSIKKFFRENDCIIFDFIRKNIKKIKYN